MSGALRETTGVAYARAGLLGNPGDAYGGKALAIAVENFSARVTLRPAAHFAIVRGPAEALEFPSLHEGLRALRENGCYDAVRLLRAAVSRFATHSQFRNGLPQADARMRFEMSHTTDIPRQVGLSGSSAIIIAALRALADWFSVELSAHELAELALAAEVEDLGIAAGPMDRVIQAYEGAVLMDFAGPRSAESYGRVDPARLPPMFLAWDQNAGDASGFIHGDVRKRFEQGDPAVREAMATFPRLVDEGMACLQRADIAGFQKCVNENFDTRASIWKLRARDLEMVSIGREQGAAVKFAGSGGAVIGVIREVSEFAAIERAYRAAGYGVVQPRIAAPSLPGAAQ